MATLANLSPASTYPDILQIANDGQGLLTVPGQVQDGIGNPTLMTLGSTLINFNRAMGEFQIDGVALTANINTLNNITDVAQGAYLLTAPNNQLPNASICLVGQGLQIISGGGFFQIAPASELEGLENLGTLGLVVRSNAGAYETCQLVVDGTLNLINANGITGNPTLNVVNDTNTQRVNIQENGVFQSTKSQLNFIPGTNMGIVVQDNPGQNRTDITFSSNFIQALFFKASCYASSTANLTVTYNNGLAGVGATLTNAGALAAFAIDGTNPPVNSRILIKDQTAQLQNGIYSVTTIGSGGVAWVLTRTSDFNSAATIQPGDFTSILNGTVNVNTTWVETNVVGVVGGDPINFVRFGFYGTVTSVTGTANQIDVANPTTTPVISIDPAYVGQNSITTLGTITTGTWNGTTITVPHGGTGLATLTTAYGVVCAGTTAAGNLQNAGTGTAGQILTSNGNAALPSWQNTNASSFDLQVNFINHGFIVGNVIFCDGANNYNLAIADNAADSEVIGIVTSVQDANNFTFQFGGIITVLTGLVAGNVYFLDAETAGRMTATPPSTAGEISKPLLIAITSTSGYWMNQRGQVL